MASLVERIEKIRETLDRHFTFADVEEWIPLVKATKVLQSILNEQLTGLKPESDLISTLSSNAKIYGAGYAARIMRVAGWGAGAGGIYEVTKGDYLSAAALIMFGLSAAIASSKERGIVYLKWQLEQYGTNPRIHETGYIPKACRIQADS